MQISTKYLFACLLALVFLCRASSAASACYGIRNVNPKDCSYGVIEYCGKYICAKGTGAKCSNNRYSPFRCGTGNFCLCGRCQGCSLHNVSDCYQETTNCFSK
ncbi:neuroparsin-A-like [Amphibalanus amphitrite]|uniref:neuroparsin-A-like n=1 Tax=Amphibalanus amphitrite TaxID=1232801 RepID=UPI001C904105|nr:neuroparsin-A-like [Amphibalanus amphitrite]